MHTCKSILLDYKHLDSWIRQEYIKLKADKVQNSRVSRDDYRNSKKGIE